MMLREPAISKLPETSKRVAIVAVLLLLFCMPVAAEKINFIGIDSPPYSYLVGERPAGLNVQWIDKVRENLPYRSDIYVYPLKRAMHEVKTNTSSVLFGLARTSQREPDFKWVAPMYDVKIGHVTSAEVRSPEHQFRAKYCVHAGSPMEQLLAAQGERDVISLLTDERCLDMLEQGMVSVWFTEFNVARYLAKQHEVAMALQFGKPVKTMSLYVAVAKDFPEQNLQQLEKTCAQAKAFHESNELVHASRNQFSEFYINK